MTAITLSITSWVTGTLCRQGLAVQWHLHGGRLWEHDPPRCLKDKNVLMVLGCSTKKYSIFRTFMEFCNCYSYRTNSRMSWLLRSWVHNCQTKNGLNPLKIAANVDLTRWKVAEIGRLYVVDRTLSRHSQSRLRPHDVAWPWAETRTITFLVTRLYTPGVKKYLSCQLENVSMKRRTCAGRTQFYISFFLLFRVGSWFHDEIQWPGPVT